MPRTRALAIAAAALGICSPAIVAAPRAEGQSATNGRAAVTPTGDLDPGQTIIVANATETPRDLCNSAQRERQISIDILTTADGIVSGPHLGKVGSVDGRWSVQITLAPDLAPGGYKALASCYNDPPDGSGAVRSYDPALFTVRMQKPGTPNVRPSEAKPGEAVQVGSGPAKCSPPKGAAAPKVRANLLDNGGSTRAAGEAQVSSDGSWAVTLHVPQEMTAQVGGVTASCLARLGAPPYAEYSPAKLTVAEAAPSSTTSTEPAPSTTLGPGQTPPPTTVQVPTTLRGLVPKLPGFTEPLPPSPVAVAIVAEPNYTG